MFHVFLKFLKPFVYRFYFITTKAYYVNFPQRSNTIGFVCLEALYGKESSHKKKENIGVISCFCACVTIGHL